MLSRDQLRDCEATDECSSHNPRVQGFVRPASRKILQSGSSPAKLLNTLQSYRPPISLVETLKAEAEARGSA